jgi:hypothetical protein
MGVSRTQLPTWDDLQILTAQLHRLPLMDDADVDTELVLSRRVPSFPTGDDDVKALLGFSAGGPYQQAEVHVRDVQIQEQPLDPRCREHGPDLARVGGGEGPVAGPVQQPADRGAQDVIVGDHRYGGSLVGRRWQHWDDVRVT